MSRKPGQTDIWMSWLRHDHVLATVEGSASLTQNLSMHLILIQSKSHWKPRNQVRSQSPTEHLRV